MLFTLSPGVSQVQVEGTFFDAPLVNYDLYLDFAYSEIVDSTDLQNLIDSGMVTLQSGGIPITNLKEQLGTNSVSSSSSTGIAAYSFDTDESEVEGEDWESVASLNATVDAGTYEVALSFLWEADSTSHGLVLKVLVDGEEEFEMEKTSAGKRSYAAPDSLAFPTSVYGGLVEIDIQVKTQHKSKWVKLWNKYLKLTKLPEAP